MVGVNQLILCYDPSFFKPLWSSVSKEVKIYIEGVH